MRQIRGQHYLYMRGTFQSHRSARPFTEPSRTSETKKASGCPRGTKRLARSACDARPHRARKRASAAGGDISMSRMNWSRDHSRRTMRLHGTEGARDEDTFVRPLLRRPSSQPRRRLSKEELRAQAAQAFAAWRERQQP